jgi:hypothetical protein
MPKEEVPVSSALAFDRMQSLRRTPLLHALDDDELILLEPLLDDIDIDPGEVVIREGHVGQHALIIVTGRAVVSAGGRVVTTLGPTDVIGELALVSNAERRPATATAVTPMRLRVLDPQRLASSANGSCVLAKIRAVLARRPDVAPVAPSVKSHGSRADFRCRYCLADFATDDDAGYCLYSPDGRHALQPRRR